MATKKSTQVNILAPEFTEVEFSLVGDTPLIVHCWDEKAKAMIRNKEGGKATRKKHDIRVPVNDFINSLMWLSPKPVLGVDDEDARNNYYAALKEGAHFGFSIGGIKKSFVTGAGRGGLDVKMTELRGAFFISGATEYATFEYAEILSDSAPVMREDPVRVGAMSKTADLRYRAQFDQWRIPLKMRVNAHGKYTVEQLLNCVTIGGFVSGLGEWRPERDGQNGMYHLEI